MNFFMLSSFEAVARLGNYSGAASELEVTPQALSASIIALERELGYPLFERTKGKQNQLNSSGKIFLPYVRQILSSYTLALQELENDRAEQSSHITLASTGVTFSNVLLQPFQREHPDITIHRMTVQQDELAQYAEKRDADFILTTELDKLPGTESRALWSEQVYLVVFAGHPLAQRDSVQLEELHDESFVLYPKQFYWHKFVRKICKKAGFKPNVAAECFLPQYPALLKQGCVSILSESAIKSSILDEQTFPRILLADPFCKRTIRLIRRMEARYPAAAQLFWDFACTYDYKS